MTHNKDGSFDFDPNVDYLAEVRAEQGEGVKESVGGVAEPFDSAQFEADTLQKVADAKEAVAPTPEFETEIAQITLELKGETVMKERAIGNWSPERIHDEAAMLRQRHETIMRDIHKGIQDLDDTIALFGRENTITKDVKRNLDSLSVQQRMSGSNIARFMHSFPDSEKYFRTGG